MHSSPFFPSTYDLQFLGLDYLWQEISGFHVDFMSLACAVIFEGKGSWKLFGTDNTSVVKVHGRGNLCDSITLPTWQVERKRMTARICFANPLRFWERARGHHRQRAQNRPITSSLHMTSLLSPHTTDNTREAAQFLNFNEPMVLLT